MSEWKKSEWKNWTIPGEVFLQVLNNLPDGWHVSIVLNSELVQPYIRLTNEDGVTPWDADGPDPLDESLVDCIGRLVQLAVQENNDE